MRKKPYTEIGIGRVPCIRCGAPSYFQWQFCADGNQYRGLCIKCDLLLNNILLKFIRDPQLKEKMEAYIKKVAGMIECQKK